MGPKDREDGSGDLFRSRLETIINPRHELAPFDRSSLTRWRQRLGEDKLTELIKESLSSAERAGALRLKDIRRVIIDTTVHPKNIAFPTDAKLLYSSIVRLGRLCRRHRIKLRQTYVGVGKQALIKAQRYAHAKQFKRHRREVKFLRVRLGRIVRDIHRNVENDEKREDIFAGELAMAIRLRLQKKRQAEPKLHSLHAPEVECIGKGKAHKPYEFGCKVSVATTNARSPGGMFVLHAKALHGNPHDGHTLKCVTEEIAAWIGASSERIYVDKGYAGHKASKPLRVFRSGQKRGVHGQIRRELKRRAAIEPVIGHLKEEHRLGRNFLKGREGDCVNAILAAACLNFRRIAQWLRLLMLKILSALRCQKAPITA